MSDRVPSFFMLGPGPWREREEVVRVLATAGVNDGFEVRIVEDAHLAKALSWGRRGPVSPAVLARVAEGSHAALLEVSGLLHQQAPLVARMGRALRDAGGAAVRMEASGAASAWEPWLENLESGNAFRIYASAVLIVGGEGGSLFTCGMHQFDLPEAEITMEDRQQAMAWLDVFCVYQIEEEPGLATGHTFQPDAESERRAFERWPDQQHPPSDGRHNPFGVWRFLAPGERGVEAGDEVLTMVPALVAILTAAERSAERPLTQPEVEAIVEQSSCIAMAPREALAVERSRGYADIEPELAWAQWQIVRASR